MKAAFALALWLEWGERSGRKKPPFREPLSSALQFSSHWKEKGVTILLTYRYMSHCALMKGGGRGKESHGQSYHVVLCLKDPPLAQMGGEK